MGFMQAVIGAAIAWVVPKLLEHLLAKGKRESGEIIEEYPTDMPCSNCLIYGESFAGEPMHSVWAYNQATQ